MFWLQTIQLTAHQSCGRLCWVVTGLQTPDSPRWECWGSGLPWHPGYHMLLRDLEAVIMERQREGASFQTHRQTDKWTETNTLVYTVIQMFGGTNTQSEEQTDTCKDNHMHTHCTGKIPKYIHKHMQRQTGREADTHTQSSCQPCHKSASSINQPVPLWGCWSQPQTLLTCPQRCRALPQGFRVRCSLQNDRRK